MALPRRTFSCSVAFLDGTDRLKHQGVFSTFTSSQRLALQYKHRSADSYSILRTAEREDGAYELRPLAAEHKRISCG